jgi:hypothetical protein
VGASRAAPARKLPYAQLYSRYLCMDLGAGATRDASREHASALARTPPTRANRSERASEPSGRIVRAMRASRPKCAKCAQMRFRTYACFVLGPFRAPGFSGRPLPPPTRSVPEAPAHVHPVAFLATHRPPLASTWVNAPRSYGQTLRSAICVLHHVTVVTVAFCLPACTGAVLPGVQAVRGGLGSRVLPCESLCT